jgi:ribosomal protein S12 methylthiotransferase accessory factor
VQFDDLIRFLKLTGAFERFAADVLGRAAVAGRPMRMTVAGPSADDSGDEASAAQYLLDSTRLVWGWESPEEAHVTMRDLGLGLQDISASLEPQVVASRLVERFASHPPRAFKRALRTELWLNDLSLKREALRLGALQYFARLEGDHSELADSDIDDAKRTICRLRAAMQWSVARSDLRDLGVSDAELDGMVQQLARARRNGRPVVEALDRRPRIRPVPSRAARWRARGRDFEPSPKAGDSNRFSLPLADAATTADSIARQMGVVRIGLIGELDTLGIHVAQAFGERSGWSSSFSSGKAETREGARIGSVMEEAELHAQDAYQPRVALRASFSDGAGSAPLIDPRTLDLPFDSRYAATLELEWSPCHDLITGTEVLVPSACLLGERQPNDIYYSPRLGGKIFSSSGLGSGFTLAEAAVHAAAEYIERHALRLAEIELDNPGGVGVRQFWFVDLDSLPETPRRIVDKYRSAGMSVRLLDITSDIAVPTFFARVFDDPFETAPSTSSDGFGCHPDPEVAVTMALLEAAQTKAGVIAGGREDYSLQARSLGRHERPRTMVPRSQVFWFCNDRPQRPFSDTTGYTTRDILDELEWIVARVEDAGYARFLVADYTMSRIRPAHAVRVLIPAAESTNPLFTGARARATVIRDLLPRVATAHT